MTPSWWWRTSSVTGACPPTANGRPSTWPSKPSTKWVNPTILATLTVVAAILPMAFVGGLMGPVHAAHPIGASAAIVFRWLGGFRGDAVGGGPYFEA